MKKELKKRMKHNKGFSMVELIIVIAIMAVLITVLAPQFIAYVEKSNYQKDVSMINEVANAIEVALADPTIYDTIPAAGATIAWTAGAVDQTNIWTQLNTEISNSINLTNDTDLTSKRLEGNLPSITITNDGQVSVNVVAYNP